MRQCPSEGKRAARQERRIFSKNYRILLTDHTGATTACRPRSGARYQVLRLRAAAPHRTHVHCPHPHRGTRLHPTGMIFCRGICACSCSFGLGVIGASSANTGVGQSGRRQHSAFPSDGFFGRRTRISDSGSLNDGEIFSHATSSFEFRSGTRSRRKSNGM